MIIAIIKFIIYSTLIVLISKYILVRILRKLSENLNLKPHTIGNITGIATSVPEFLTVSISSFKGLMGTGIYNIFSSNLINLLQYIISVILTKNYKEIKNKGILYNIILVIITIVIPLILISLKIELSIYIVPIFLFLYFAFLYISNRIHKKFLKLQDKEIENQEGIQEKEERKTNKKTYVYIIYLILTSVSLYLIGNELGNTLEQLAKIFKISESVLGFLLGFITSMPELITFFESQKHYKEQKENKILGVIEATNNLLTSNMLNLFVIQNIGIIIFFIIRYSL
ncbi:MAG: hypothetical protein ACLVA2_02890 [Clostridia bacterium]